MKVLLGVCGGVATYKAAELTRELQRRGADVQVVMTASAERFITPLTFAALSGRPVLTSLWTPSTSEIASEDTDAFDIEHIRVAQEIDALILAPATANFIAKLAHGMADDLLSTICLATTAPILLAPAMNVNMWRNPATQANLDTIRARGGQIIAPSDGYLACGMVGEGRLADPIEIAAAVVQAASAASGQTRDLIGETILITAGGTREAIDAVRYIGNRSSGRTGLALAEAATARGAKAILITAAATATSSTSTSTSTSYEQISVTTASEMQAMVLTHLSRASVVIMAAAVSDYRVDNPSTQKMKKRATLTLELTQNEDILRQIVLHRHPDTIVIGFAAETEHVLTEGRRKLREKGVDAIFANDVSTPDSGFEVDRNAGTLLTRDEELDLGSGSKRTIADRILNSLSAIRTAHHRHSETLSVG
jgi:phosphopantothenoylcysteine decarboxylase/phosphopantothenate--cysteine ligase